jgi:hypothetical protein
VCFGKGLEILFDIWCCLGCAGCLRLSLVVLPWKCQVLLRASRSVYSIIGGNSLERYHEPDLVRGFKNGTGIESSKALLGTSRIISRGGAQLLHRGLAWIDCNI